MRQFSEHPSPGVVLPSSQFSTGDVTTPSPQTSCSQFSLHPSPDTLFPSSHSSWPFQTNPSPQNGSWQVPPFAASSGQSSVLSKFPSSQDSPCSSTPLPQTSHTILGSVFLSPQPLARQPNPTPTITRKTLFLQTDSIRAPLCLSRLFSFPLCLHISLPLLFFCRSESRARLQGTSRHLGKQSPARILRIPQIAVKLKPRPPNMILIRGVNKNSSQDAFYTTAGPFEPIV